MGNSSDAQELLRAPLTIGYDFRRTTGPVIGAFFTALAGQRVLGIRDMQGRVVCPPVEYDPQSGEPLTEMVEVASEGTVTTWSWVSTVRDGQPLQRPHALAMIRLDGADTAMLHVIDASGPDAVSTGSRVRIRWAAGSTEGSGASEGSGNPEGLANIECFELTGEVH